MTDLFCIACTIEHGAFTEERVFEIQLSDKIKASEGGDTGKLVGTAHTDHLRDQDRNRLQEDQPGYGNSIKGFVLCRKLRELAGGWVIVEVPSADVIHVSEDSLMAAD